VDRKGFGVAPQPRGAVLRCPQGVRQHGDRESYRMTRRMLLLLLAAVGAAGAGALMVSFGTTADTVSTGLSGGPAPIRYGYSVVQAFPHDPDAFTQGLIFRDGVLFESTGLHGRSSLRKVRLETGEVLQRLDIEERYFAEGLVDWQDALVQLTWQSNVGFVYALDTFAPIRRFSYAGEGWGLARDNARLIMSDGTSTLRFLDPDTFREIGRLSVTERGYPVTALNELEMVKGELYANVWQTDEVVIISPTTGHVTGRIDFSGLRDRLDRSKPVDVFNGIAYDEAGDRLFVTGKLWPQLFEVRILRD
jgi:glutamine cyclotransferase